MVFVNESKIVLGQLIVVLTNFAMTKIFVKKENVEKIQTAEEALNDAPVMAYAYLHLNVKKTKVSFNQCST